MKDNEIKQLFGSEIDKYIDGERLDDGKATRPCSFNNEEEVQSGEFPLELNNLLSLFSRRSSTFQASGGTSPPSTVSISASVGGGFSGVDLDTKEKNVATAEQAKGEVGDDNYYKKGEKGYISVQSSNLKAVKYDGETKQLNVQFVKGTEYSYNDVPASQFNNLLNWSSHGSYFYWNIRGAGMPRPFAPPYAYKKL